MDFGSSVGWAPCLRRGPRVCHRSPLRAMTACSTLPPKGDRPDQVRVRDVPLGRNASPSRRVCRSSMSPPHAMRCEEDPHSQVSASLPYRFFCLDGLRWMGEGVSSSRAQRERSSQPRGSGVREPLGAVCVVGHSRRPLGR